MSKLLFVQPILTSYRLGLFKGLDGLPEVDLNLYADLPNDNSFGVAQLPSYCNNPKWFSFAGFFIPRNFQIILDLFSCDVVVHVADFKYLTLWFAMLFSPKKLYLHGQGGYKKNSIFQRFIYRIFLARAKGYICYTDFSQNVLKSRLSSSCANKVYVVDNSLYLDLNKLDCSGDDILYIGRLRVGCGIELLLESASSLNINVRVIGGGDVDFISMLKNKYTNFRYYGVLFEQGQQLAIARGCFAGAYGGDAGLSVVHYMSYGLPVVVHNEIFNHMGPEPSYVVDGKNGLSFERGNMQSLAAVLKRLKEDKSLRLKLAEGAVQTFEQLSNPPMHEKFAKILGLI